MVPAVHQAVLAHGAVIQDDTPALTQWRSGTLDSPAQQGPAALG